MEEENDVGQEKKEGRSHRGRKKKEEAEQEQERGRRTRIGGALHNRATLLREGRRRASGRAFRENMCRSLALTGGGRGLWR